MGTTVTKIVTAVAAAAAVPGLLAGAGTAHAAGLNVTPVPQITGDGIWIGWTAGSGSTWCTARSDWFSSRAYQNAPGTGGVFVTSIPLNRVSLIDVKCDNGDTGHVPGFWY